MIRKLLVGSVFERFARVDQWIVKTPSRDSVEIEEKGEDRYNKEGGGRLQYNSKFVWMLYGEIFALEFMQVFESSNRFYWDTEFDS
ncbi:hypothetical protein M0804_010908 [Polistes exclamans]|nr:hypothetical protein M0804_010908 [Polistes exclamans]